MAIAAAAMLPGLDAMAQTQGRVDLGTAGNFAVLAGQAISSTSGGTINGDVGVSPGAAFVPGTPAVIVNGVIHVADAVSLQAQNDLITAYNDAAGRTVPTLVATDLGGRTLTPGLYKDNGAPASLGLTGTLTLDALGDPNAVWIFQAAETLTAEVDSRVVLTNGAESCNVFWQVGSSATLKTRAIFVGNIMALTAISLQSGATLDGRALARNAAITLDNNTVGIPCATSILVGVPSNTVASCNAIPAAPLVTSADACSTQTSVAAMSETVLPGSCANTYTLRRVWTASSSCGDPVSATQLIDVADTSAPSIVCPPAVTVQCLSDVPPPDTNAVTAIDNCGSVTITHVGDSTRAGACSGTITRTYRATDACGNSMDCTQQITVNDTTPPQLACPPAVTVQCLSDVPPPDTNAVTATDNCGSVTITHVGDSTLAGACGGTITRTYRATDACGNFADCTQQITVNDTTPPQIACPPGPVVVTGNADCLGTVPDLTGAALVSDNCATGGLMVTQAPPAGTPFTAQTNVTLTVTDPCGWTNACTVTVSTPCGALYGSIGGTVWNDADVNGVTNENLAVFGLNNVTLQLWAVAGAVTTPVAQAVSRSQGPQQGFYVFTNLPAGIYLAAVVGGVPPQLTRNTTPGIPPYYLLTLAANETNGTVHFGYAMPSNTLVDLLYFRGGRDGGAVRLEWATAEEMNNVGFHLYRACAAHAPRARITDALIGGVGSGAGRTYAWADEAAPPGGSLFYWLEDVDLDGTTTLHGPVRVGLPPPAAVSGFRALAGSVCRLGAPALQAAGLDVAAVDGSLIEVRVDGKPVAAYCNAQGRPMEEGDYVLFYVGGGAESMRDVRVGLQEGAPRMESVYAGPLYESAANLAVAAAAAGITPVALAGTENLVAVSGLGETDAWVLDVTDPAAPRLLLGAEMMLQASGLGLFFSPAAGCPAECLVVEPRAVTDIPAPAAP